MTQEQFDALTQRVAVLESFLLPTQDIEVLKSTLHQENSVFELLFKISERIFEVTKDQIQSSNRKQKYCDVRTMIAYIVRSNTLATLRKIGDMLGNRDHSSVLHYIKKHEDLMVYDYDYRQMYFALLTEFKECQKSPSN